MTATRRTTLVLALSVLGVGAGALPGCDMVPTRATPSIGERRAAAMELVRQGEKLAAQGKIDEAADTYRAAISESSSVSPAWNNLGELMLRQGKYADAVSAFETAADLEPRDPRPVYNAGVAYQQAGWAEDALDKFSRALERDESYLPALRGAIRSAEMLSRADRVTSERIKRATLQETDPEWKAYFERQRFRVESGLTARESDRAARSSNSGS